jgi:hypothetical protein
MGSKTIAILQSNYIPWKGYFDLINSVDEFVLFDDVQYTRRDWRNRNRIKTGGGAAWLTLPVNTKGQYLTAIKDITVSDPTWPERHWKTIRANYGRAKYFDLYSMHFAKLFDQCRTVSHLSCVNHQWIVAICAILGIGTKLTWSHDYTLGTGKTERILAICQQAGASTYISGPAARSYLDRGRFDEAGIELEYFDYSGYPAYTQLFPPFDHRVSILDLLLNEGPASTRYMLSF